MYNIGWIRALVAEIFGKGLVASGTPVAVRNHG